MVSHYPANVIANLYSVFVFDAEKEKKGLYEHVCPIIDILYLLINGRNGHEGQK